MDKKKRIYPFSRSAKKSRKKKLIPVQLRYAQPDSSIMIKLHVKQGTSIREAFELSQLDRIVKGVKLVDGQVGIFGEIRSPDTILEENDRIEIYRPLKTTPQAARKKRKKNPATDTVSEQDASEGC